MYVVSVTIFVVPEKIDAFVTATQANAAGARQEPGNHRFDVAQAVDDPSRFLLYEVYDDEGAFVAHQQTEHYLSWKATVADWMAQPRQGVKHNSILPTESTDW